MDTFHYLTVLSVYILVVFLGGVFLFYKLNNAIPKTVKENYSFIIKVKAIWLSPDSISDKIKKEHLVYFYNANKIYFRLVLFLLFVFLLFSLYTNYWLYSEIVALTN